MAESAATARGLGGTVGNVADATKSRTRGSASGNRRAWPKAAPLSRRELALKSDQEVIERLTEALTAVTGKSKPDPRPLKHATELYAVLRKWAAQTGSGHGRASWRQIAQQLYPDVVTVRDTHDRKVKAMKNNRDRLEAAGVARIKPWYGPAGEARGIYWELIDEPVDAAILRGSVSPCSSTGEPTGTLRAPNVLCGVRVRHVPLDEREAGRTRLAPYRFRTGRGSICRLQIDFGPPVPRPAPFFGLALLTGPVVLPTDVGSTTEKSLQSDRSSPTAAQLGSARENELETRDPAALARLRVRDEIQASLRSATSPRMGTGGLRSTPEGFDWWLASKPERLAAVERLSGLTNPSYEQVASVFHLVRGPSFPHARRGRRDMIVAGARRYDRYALRLAVDGEPVSPPTAMALVADLAAGHRGDSIGYAAVALRQRSVALRARWRELHPERVEAAARKRRDRRVRRLAAALECNGLFYRAGSPREGWGLPAAVVDDLERLDGEVAEARQLLQEAAHA